MSAEADTSPLQLAIAAHKGGQLAEAELGYRRILRRRPDDPDALNFLGMLRFNQGHATEAIEFLRRSIESNPDNPHPRINLGNILLLGGDAQGALVEFTRATELAPEFATAWYNLAVCLRKLERYNEAVDCFFKALRREQGLSKAREALCRLLLRMGRLAEAAEVYREWLIHHPGDPIARHMLAAVTGKTVPERGSNEYVTALFEDFAETFDENLAELGYCAPQLLADRLLEHAGRDASLDILDAGCGTGLAGPLLKPVARSLVGVDLSGQMLARARERNLYDDLVEAELAAFMRSRPREFDVVLSADTLCYFGALEEPLQAARDTLRPGGVLVFSVEAWDAPEPTATYDLQPHGRYRHAGAYVRTALENQHLRVVAMDSAVLRKERGAEVVGHIVVAVRQAA